MEPAFQSSAQSFFPDTKFKICLVHVENRHNLKFCEIFGMDYRIVTTLRKVLYILVGAGWFKPKSCIDLIGSPTVRVRRVKKIVRQLKIRQTIKAFLPMHISELREQILQKVYQLIINTRRLGRRAETMRKFRSYIRPYFAENGQKCYPRWNYFHSVLEEGKC